MDKELQGRCFTLAELPHLAAEIVRQFPGVRVFAFQGDLGAGKTTFISALCHELGITDPVSSPTFALINEYAGPDGAVFHLDLYRLAGPEEAVRAGLEDCLYSGARCFVEWPERAPEILPPGTVYLRLETIDPAIRKLSFARS